MMTGTVKLLGRPLQALKLLPSIERRIFYCTGTTQFRSPCQKIPVISTAYDFQAYHQFRPVNPINLQSKKLLSSKVNQNKSSILNGLPKALSFFGKKDNNPKEKKPVPKLILIQNPFTWLLTKVDFRVLRNVWDPTFVEKEFMFGTKQAISRITQVISEGRYEQLNGLLTRPARLSLIRELDRNWNQTQRSILALERGDIQISSPRKVYFIRIADKKYCDVDMSFLALKWVPINSTDALVFTEIFAKFHREYTPHCIPEWTIAYFKVSRFQVIKRGR